MTNINIIKMSSKGQIVIPQEMRGDLKEGDKLIILQNQGQLILKKATDIDKNFQEDLEFARRTEKAWKKYDKGEFISMDSKDFLKELERW